MIVMQYVCRGCTYASSNLTEAQDHSNSTTHSLRIDGSLTPNIVASSRPASVSAQEVQERALQRHREAEILRRAKHRGLLK